MIFFVLNYFLIIFYFLDVLILKINFKNKKYIFLNKKIKKITITANLKHGKDRYPNWFWNSGQECIGRYSQRMLRLSAFFKKTFSIVLCGAIRSRCMIWKGEVDSRPLENSRWMNWTFYDDLRLFIFMFKNNFYFFILN